LIEGTIYLKYDSKGKKVGFYGFSQDVTERKRAEEKLKEYTKKIEILNRIIIEANKVGDLSSLLETILNLILELMNFDGGGIYLMDETKRIAELVCHKGLASDFVETVKQVKIDESQYHKNTFIKGQPIFTDEYPKFKPKRSKKYGFKSVANIPIFAKDKIIGFYNIVSTIRHSFSDEEKDILQSIGREIGTVIAKMQVEDELQKSEKRYRDFTSIASHEFKTPLIPIIGLPQLLLKDNNLNKQQKDSLNEILHSGKKLNKLIDDLLDTSQIERKSIKISKREIEINTLIDRCISDLSFLIKQKNHKLTKNMQEDIKLNIDDMKISRVLTNLISNTIKYTPSNGRIEISTQIDEENNFIFSIKDNGIGIEEKDQELIFQKFGKIRGEEIVKYELDSHGSGLGLFISKEIIKLHGGEMWFESAGKNNGTTFYFKLPRK